MPEQHEENSSPVWLVLLAFAIIYFVWGSTFLAIRIGVTEVPPLLFAAMRFFAAGVVLLLWVMLRPGRVLPTGRQWLSMLLLATLIFLVDYGLLFWAEQRVPSGIAAVILATIPAMIAVAEIVFLRTQRLTLPLAFALAVGVAGVAILMSRSYSLGGAPIDSAGACALLVGALGWSTATVLTRRLPLPESKVLSSGGQMLVGGVLLGLASLLLGELPRFHPAAVSRAAWLALLYLIVFGSIIGFTAYVWLIHRESPTRVGTYAYVNPVVAVLLGYVFAGEPLGLRTVLGTALVLLSVVLLTTTKAAAALKPQSEETA